MRSSTGSSSSVGSNSLSRGQNTFTPERLTTILQNERISYNYKIRSKAQADRNIIHGPTEIRYEFGREYFQYEETPDGVLQGFSKAQAKSRAMEFCRRLYGHDSPISIAVTNLDATFSKIFPFRFEPLKESRKLVEQACNLLERMPVWPPELMDTPTAFPSEYYASSVVENAPKDARLWERLQATTYVSSTVLRAALAAVMDRNSGFYGENMMNVIARLLETVSRLSSSNTDTDTLWRSFIVRAFLWTTWQRCQLIFFYSAADIALTHGALDGKRGKLALHGTSPSPGITIHEMSKRHASSNKPSYMCSWNFELLRINPVCIGADFRRFFQIYNAAFGHASARCLIGQSYACKGDSPHSCQRFYGMVIQDQSAHDQSCNGDCRQLIWDEMSYRALSGARAVHLTQCDSVADQSIKYCNTSDQTLAISHVWSQ